jgi:hypothetical protein
VLSRWLTHVRLLIGPKSNIEAFRHNLCWLHHCRAARGRLDRSARIPWQRTLPRPQARPPGPTARNRRPPPPPPRPARRPSRPPCTATPWTVWTRRSRHRPPSPSARAAAAAAADPRTLRGLARPAAAAAAAGRPHGPSWCAPGALVGQISLGGAA